MTQTTTYLSERSIKGFPYLAEAILEQYQTKDGRTVWRPRGPVHSPQQCQGVPYTWHRKGTKATEEIEVRYADSPRPWDQVSP